MQNELAATAKPIATNPHFSLRLIRSFNPSSSKLPRRPSTTKSSLLAYRLAVKAQWNSRPRAFAPRTAVPDRRRALAAPRHALLAPGEEPRPCLASSPATAAPGWAVLAHLSYTSPIPHREDADHDACGRARNRSDQDRLPEIPA